MSDKRSQPIKILSYIVRSFVCFLQWCLNIFVISVITNQHVRFIRGEYIDYSRTVDCIIVIALIGIVLFSNWLVKDNLSATGEENS